MNSTSGMHGGHKALGEMHHGHNKMIVDYWRRFKVSLLLTIPVIILSPTVQGLIGYSIILPGSTLLLWTLAFLIYAYGGKPFLVGLYREIRDKNPGMMTLIGVAITTAFIYSSLVSFIIPGKTFYWELSSLIDIMLLGHWVEMKSILGSSRAIEELVKLMPARAHLVRPDGSIVDVEIDMLNKNNRVQVRPGEKIPVDGVVVAGESSVDESIVTGESGPIYKSRGSKVIAGSINLDGTLVVEVLAAGRETYLAKVVELVKSVQGSKSRMQDLANRVAKWLTLIALVVGAVTFTTWYTYMGDPIFALERAVTVMVITCPHALGLAIPLVISRSTALGARHGILIRNRIAFEKAYKVDTVVMDKTGTLTRGEPVVVDVIPIYRQKIEEILAYAASVESRSSHPIAKAIMKYSSERGIKPFEIREFRNIPGIGVKAYIGDHIIAAVSPRGIRETLPEKVEELVKQGYTVVVVLVDDEPIGAIAIDDEIRGESYQAVKTLHEKGVRVVMLTGDSQSVAERVAEKIGIKEYYAELMPHQKVEVIEGLREKGKTVAMIGDGINDAPALAEADVGIAIGAGTDIAIESADIVLVRSDPRDVVKVIELSRRTYSKIKQNLLWAVGYNVFAIPVAAGLLYGIGFLLPPALGALLMSASTVIVAINASLLK